MKGSGMKPWLRRTLGILAIYALANVAFFLANPFASPWHYRDHDPVPLEVELSGDRQLSAAEIVRILDEIDLAYGAREPSVGERGGRVAELGVGLILFPATAALIAQEFMGYIGPATDSQQAFTISVKLRYNHLAHLAVEKGYLAEDRFLFQIEPSLTKKCDISFDEIGRFSH